jgi:hypothetical protein
MMDEIWHMRVGFPLRRDRYLWCRLGMMSKIEYGLLFVLVVLLLDKDLNLNCWRLQRSGPVSLGRTLNKSMIRRYGRDAKNSDSCRDNGSKQKTGAARQRKKFDQWKLRRWDE